MKPFSGILIAIIGAFILILSYFTGLVDYNLVQFIAILLVIAGIGTHIYVNYRKPKYEKN